MQHEERGELARAIIEILDDWGVGAVDQIDLLGFPPGTDTGAIGKCRRGAPLPETPEVDERVEHIAGIADALRTSYPRNLGMGRLWLNRPHHLFDGRTPLSVMIAEGVEGIIAVRTNLDCAWDWRTNG